MAGNGGKRRYVVRCTSDPAGNGLPAFCFLFKSSGVLLSIQGFRRCAFYSGFRRFAFYLGFRRFAFYSRLPAFCLHDPPPCPCVCAPSFPTPRSSRRLPLCLSITFTLTKVTPGTAMASPATMLTCANLTAIPIPTPTNKYASKASG